jgi:SAM-dependent methyltransferase
VSEETAKSLCPYCGGRASVRIVGRDINRLVSEDKFYLLKCDLCGLMFINNPPRDLSRYYTSDYHFVPASVEALDALLPSEQFKIDLLTKFVSGGTLLEIGPSNGMFCRLAQKAGFVVSAIEMDEDCVRFLNETLGVRVVASSEPAAVLSSEKYTYDAICLWHAIEHMPRPWIVLEEAARRLNPGGVLLLAAPNPDAWQARLLKSYWPHHDMPRHLFALPIPWLVAFGKKNGLTQATITTCDEGSLYWNKFTWAMLLRSFFSAGYLRSLSWRVGIAVGRLLDPWERREGQGAAYTAVLRRSL